MKGFGLFVATFAAVAFGAAAGEAAAAPTVYKAPDAIKRDVLLATGPPS